MNILRRLEALERRITGGGLSRRDFAIALADARALRDSPPELMRQEMSSEQAWTLVCVRGDAELAEYRRLLDLAGQRALTDEEAAALERVRPRTFEEMEADYLASEPIKLATILAP